MITQEISLKIWGHVEDYILINNFETLLYYYKKSGQIQSDDEPIHIETNFIKCNVLTLEKNSFAKRYNTNCVNLQIKKIENLLLATPQIKLLGQWIKDNSDCRCKKSDFYILTTNPYVIFGPIVCGICDKIVPLYKIVGLTEELKESIFTWEENHQCYSITHIRGLVGDKLAIEQMADYKSQLSTEGINISKELYKITGIPTFYDLLNDKIIKFKEKSLHLCPSCNCEWFLKSGLISGYYYKCDKCYLISDGGFSDGSEYKIIS